MPGSELKLGISVRDKALKNPLETKYFDCHEPVSPEVSHTNYKLDTFKGGFKDIESINVTWMLMCCRLVQNKIGYFQMENVLEVLETNDSEAGSVDNVNKMHRRKRAKKHKRKRVFNVTMPYLHPKACEQTKRKMPHMDNFQFIPQLRTYNMECWKWHIKEAQRNALYYSLF